MSGPVRVLLVGDEPREATTMVEMLRDAWPDGLLVSQTRHLADAVLELADHGDCCVLLHLPDGDLARLRALVSAAPTAAVVVISDGDPGDSGVAAVSAGAQDHLLRTDLGPALLTRTIRFALERKQAELRLTRQSFEDPLTGLPNRVLFLDRLNGALDRSRRTAVAPAVMFLDIDSFKEVNDTLGHSAGDQLLCVLATRFGAMLRPMDTVGRLGGDEFTFLFEGLSGHEEALAIARRLAQAAREPVALGGRDQETTVAVSIGVEMLRDPEVPLEDALRGADEAMYRAKHEGGGRAALAGPGPLDWRAAPPSRPAGRDPEPLEPALAAQLRDALRLDQLRAHYQPRVSFDGRTGLVGFEALVRWAHPGRGLLGPAEFMGVAEDSGLAAEIGEWVVDDALQQVASWRRARPAMTISVNLSRGQLLHPGLAESLRARLQRAGVPTDALCLEVAESAILEDPAGCARAFADLRRLGVELAIDDVGRGEAAGSVLAGLPIQMLKIDRSIISQLADADTAGGAQLARGVVELGHRLGLTVVAGGVETDRQLVSVRGLGCDGAQGFLFSRPVPESSVAELLGTG